MRRAAKPVIRMLALICMANVPLHTDEVQLRSRCTGFSAEQRRPEVGLLWSYRICENHERRELQIRFRNARPDTAHFVVRVFNRDLDNCRSSAPSLVKGGFTVAPQGSVLLTVGLTDQRPVKRIWLCFTPTNERKR